MKKILFSFFLFFLSCKTQEQIKEGKLIKTISIQMTENQNLTAKSTVKMGEFEGNIQELRGLIEENNHLKNQEIQQLKNQLTLLEESRQSLNNEIKMIKDQLKSQNMFIQEILNNFKKKRRTNLYSSAMSNYKKRHYKKAKIQLNKLQKSSKYKGRKRARILHNLGMISFIQKKNQDAITYFSKLFTEFPKSTYNINGLMQLSYTFIRLKQKNRAKQTLNEIIKRFPKSKKIKKVKKLLKSL